MTASRLLVAALLVLPVFAFGRPPLGTVALTSSPNPAGFGKPVILTAAISAPDPTGSVTFYDGTSILGVAPVVQGQATLVTTLLPSGTRSLTARYSGDGSYPTKTSPPISQVVNATAGEVFQSASFPTGDLPSSVAVGDFNGDNFQDLVVVNSVDNSVSVFLGDGNGSFAQPVSYPVGDSPFGVALADVNEDGKTDLIVASSTDNSLGLLYGNGDGTFAHPTRIAATHPSINVAIGDFNHDGHADLATTSIDTTEISIYLGNGDGTFQTAVQYTTTGETFGIASGDVNGDGYDDLVVTSYDSGVVSVFIGTGDGTFQIPTDYPLGYNLFGVALGDFNHDGYLDMVVTVVPGAAAVFLNQGNGTFGVPLLLPVGFSPIYVVLGDFNGDGVTDLAVSSLYENSVWTLLGRNDGTFQQATSTPAGGAPFGIAVGDFNRDGRADIASVGSATNSLTIFSRAGIATATTLTASSSSVRWGDNVTFTAFVSPSTVPGTVTFTDGPNVIGTAPVESGIASLSTNALAAGQHQITATYNYTNLNYARSTGSVLVDVTGCVAQPTPALYFDKNGGTQNLQVSATTSGCGWVATTESSWITVVAANGAGSGVLPITVSSNVSGVSRTGSVSVGGQAVTITQRSSAEVAQDVPSSSYAFDAVNLLYAKGVTSGCTANDFCPDQLLPRWQAAILLVRAAFGNDNFTVGQTPYFHDVAPTDPGFLWIQKLYEMGITVGCGNGNFCPTSNLTRAETAVFIIRLRYGATTQFDYSNSPAFTDVPVNNFAFAWVQRMKTDGITNGCSATQFCPDRLITRGEMAYFLAFGAFNDLHSPGGPVLSLIQPSFVSPGQTGTFQITAQNTHFTADQTYISPLPGITINSVVVGQSTSLTVNYTADSVLPNYPLSVYVRTVTASGVEEVVLPNALQTNGPI